MGVTYSLEIYPKDDMVKWHKEEGQLGMTIHKHYGLYSSNPQETSYIFQ